MDEILKRMLQNNLFKNYLLIDQSMNPIKQILIDYMEFSVLDDYYSYYNFRNAPEETFNKNVKQYRRNLLNSLYNLGYKNNISLREYIQRCFDLHRDLKDSIKTDNIGHEYKTIMQSKNKRNHSC